MQVSTRLCGPREPRRFRVGRSHLVSATGADSRRPVLPAQFIFALLKRVSKGEEANKAAQEAYKETLMQYHGFMVKKTFQMGLMAAPSTASSRKGFSGQPMAQLRPGLCCQTSTSLRL